MLHIMEATYVGEYKIRLRYPNGIEGIVDFGGHERINMLQPWDDLSYFASFRINPETGTLEWPNGVDISPEYLYSKVSGVPQEAAFIVMLAEQAKINCARVS